MSLPLRLDGVSVGYGNRLVLDRLTLTVRAGALVALLGPSGCGKTTVLKSIAGLLPPTSGDVWVGTERLTDVPAERRDIAMVFQKPLLFPHMSVADNVGFGLTMRGMPLERRRHAVADVLALVQLEGFGDRRPKALSGGQEQRVALARALVTEPRLLLLDEPLTALDEYLRRELRGLVRDLQQRLGITTVFVTHDQDEAADVADEVALLLNGRLAQQGPPRDFYTRPASEAVARFFGWCVLPGARDGDCFRAAGACIPIPRDLVPGTNPSAVGFHPSGARIRSHVGDETGAFVLPVMVERVSDLGAQLRCTARLSSGHRIEVTQPTAGMPVDPLVPGQEARLSIGGAVIRFFS